MVKVLVVEDDDMLSSVLVLTLKAAGIDAKAAADGFDAEIEVKSWHPDLVLLDLLMPKVDGFTFLRDIRADSETSKTNVIVLSNYSAEETIERVKKFGVIDYLVKAETNPNQIVAKIHAMFPEGAPAAPAAAPAA